MKSLNRLIALATFLIASILGMLLFAPIASAVQYLTNG